MNLWNTRLDYFNVFDSKTIINIIFIRHEFGLDRPV